MSATMAQSCREHPLNLVPKEMPSFAGNACGYPGHECRTDLYLGFFFDGTNNNQDNDVPKQAHSNVARLAALYGAKRRAEVLRPVYVPGVGTRFDDVGDSGTGIHRDAGLASAWAGEARINWALLQVHNRLHASFCKEPLSSRDLDKSLVRRVSADLNLSTAQLRTWLKHPLRTAWQQKSIPPRHAERRALLRERNAELTAKIAPQLATRRPTVEKLRLSVFGFSRGAAEARVFVNWLLEACTPGGKTGQLLGGIPLQIDFLGLFDTVASVGYAQSFQEFFLDGHDAWATPQALKVPPAVRRCVHLVAAHEVRGSFPLDSVAGAAGSWKEVVYPGVHSDIGGGYRPGEQGREPRDSDKLSQIPLAEMYREAVMAGVPLNLGDAPERARAAMEISPGLRQAFNAYLAGAGNPQDVNTWSLIEQHSALYLRWRRARLGKMAGLPALARCTPQDRTDLLEADDELSAEADLMSRDHDHLSSPLAWLNPLQLGREVVDRLWARKLEQWAQIRPHWTDAAPLPPAVAALFDAYMHDSRAWFKPFADNDEDWAKDVAARLRAAADSRHEAAREKAAAETAPTRGMAELHHRRQVLASAHARRLEQQPMVQASGREPYLLGWGYLRWRTIYTCFDESLAESTAREDRLRSAMAGDPARTPAELAAARRRALLQEERRRLEGQQLDARDIRAAQHRIGMIDRELEQLANR